MNPVCGNLFLRTPLASGRGGYEDMHRRGSRGTPGTAMRRVCAINHHPQLRWKHTKTAAALTKDLAKDYARQNIWRFDSAVTLGEDAVQASENQAEG
jgi:hypothetical protein